MEVGLVGKSSRFLPAQLACTHPTARFGSSAKVSVTVYFCNMAGLRIGFNTATVRPLPFGLVIPPRLFPPTKHVTS